MVWQVPTNLIPGRQTQRHVTCHTSISGVKYRDFQESALGAGVSRITTYRQSGSHLKSSHMVRKDTPGLPGSPSMVYVLPEPV